MNEDEALEPVALTCAGCGSVWESTARAGSNVRCPDCRERHYITKAERPTTEAETGAKPSGEAEAWDSSEPLTGAAQTPSDGQPTGYPCPACEQPTVWAGARAGIRCTTAGHLSPSPNAQDRANARLAAKVRAERREAASNEDAVPVTRSDFDIKASVDFKIARGQYEANIKKIARDYANWLNEFPDNVWTNNCIDAITRLTAMLSEVNGVRTLNELGAVQRVIGNDLNQIDNNRNNIERHITNLRNYQELNSQAIAGEIVSDESDSPRAITAGGSNRRKPDAYVEYDDDDEYDDYEDGEYVSGGIPSAAMFKAVLVIGAFIVVYATAKSIMDSDVPRKCDGKHIGIPPPAIHMIYGYTGQLEYKQSVSPESRFSCGRDKCSNPMAEYFANLNWTVAIDGNANNAPYQETRRERFKRKHPDNSADSV